MTFIIGLVEGQSEIMLKTRDHAENPFLESNLKKDLFHEPPKGRFILMLLLFQYCCHFHFWSVLEIGLS